MKKMILLCLLCFPLLAKSANQTDLEKLSALKNTQNIHLDLSNADLRHYTFIPGKIDLQRANLSHSNLSGVDLSKMDLTGANLSYADLSNAKLKQTNLSDANLDHANLSGAELIQSNLSRANLSFSILTTANLQQATFTKANLTCANLNRADLTKSSFAETNISGAVFIDTITNDVVNYHSVIERRVDCESYGLVS